MLFEHRYSFGQRITLANGSISRHGRDLLMVRPRPESHNLTFVRDWLPNVGR